MSVSSMAWRKPGEGLSITTKSKKEGSGGKMVNFFVGIAHGAGVILSQPASLASDRTTLCRIHN